MKEKKKEKSEREKETRIGENGVKEIQQSH